MSTVPITSDLAGYARFWDTWLTRAAVGASVWAVAVLVLLFAMWRKP